MLDLRRWCIKLGDNLVGFERSRVHIDGKPYMDRWILYVGFGTIRLHKFWRGDDDRAPHDHPWNFWTFPLKGYIEQTDDGIRYVKPWRLHKRAADFRHIVIGTEIYGRTGWKDVWDTRIPFYTIVFTGNRIRGWGFWPKSNLVYPDGFGNLLPLKEFVPWRQWK